MSDNNKSPNLTKIIGALQISRTNDAYFVFLHNRHPNFQGGGVSGDTLRDALDAFVVEDQSPIVQEAIERIKAIGEQCNWDDAVIFSEDQ